MESCAKRPARKRRHKRNPLLLPSHPRAQKSLRFRSRPAPPKKISCRIHSTNCVWLTLKLPTRWLARPGDGHGFRQKMKATLTVLGSGTSMGVPTIGCDCAVCHSSDPHDRRTRPSVLVEYDGRVVLIDSTPDFYQQAIRERITHLDAVLYTHAHADHILGIDDLRPLSFRHKPGKLALYARPQAASIALDGGKFIEDRRATAATARLLHSHLSRFTARADERNAAARRAIVV